MANRTFINLNLFKMKRLTLRETGSLMFFPLIIFYMEIIVKISCFGGATPEGVLYTGLFSVSIGLAYAFICSLLNGIASRILSTILLGITAIFCSAQIVYFAVFKTFGTLYSLFAGADAITDFWSGTLSGIRDSVIPLCLILIPYILFVIFGGKIVPFNERSRGHKIVLLAGTAGFYLLALILVMSSNSGIMPVKYLYREAFIPNLSVTNFGVMTTLRLDVQNLLFGGGDDTDDETEPEEEPVQEPEVIEYGFNALEIDFDALIAGETDETVKDMHEYFSSLVPTKKNEYTGLFKGKNLIWIVAEAFSTLALNEEVTPTLCKLAREGFVFNNFYNPVWSVSTSDGEYVTLTSLIPKSGVWSFKRSANNYMHYCFGNLLTPLGYKCKAYHNHYYSYYDRHLSHPNMGYDYKGLGNGLKVTEVWPESDLEMMQITIPGDITQTPFHNYYMTVSGHLNYTFYGNMMASRHQDKVRDLPYSTEGCKAYLACNIELDLALQYILEQLEAAGQSENTVIALSGDHYPYGLEDEEMDELAGHVLEKKFEKFKSTLIIWSGSMKEPVVVDKVCSSLDVLPTLANLLGVDYDSRLIMGQDILSDSPGLVEFNDRSWISDKGRYDAKSNVFTPNEGVSVGDEYARNTLAKVNNEFAYSAKILDKDYYSIVFMKDKKE